MLIEVQQPTSSNSVEDFGLFEFKGTDLVMVLILGNGILVQNDDF